MPLQDLTRRTPHTSPHLQLPRHWSPHYAWWHLRAPRVLELSVADEVPKAIQQPSQWLKWRHCRWSLGREKWKESKILSPSHKEFFYTPPVAIGSGKRWFRCLESLLLEGSLSGSTVHPWGCMHGRYSKISASASSDCINHALHRILRLPLTSQSGVEVHLTHPNSWMVHPNQTEVATCRSFPSISFGYV